MIPADNKEDVIQSGINFMRSITEAFGTDEGLKLWDTIASTLDPDVKGQIFFAMLTGEYNSRITLYSAVKNANKVSMIKAIRIVDKRGIGLKEAKDMADGIENGIAIHLEVDPKKRISCITELRNAGFHV